MSERNTITKRRFHKGDHVSWNSEAGYVSGRVIKVIASEIVSQRVVYEA